MVLTLFRERYEVLATLGAGGEAQVVKALDRQHDRVVALKVRPARNAATREELLNEARVLLAVPPHPALPLVREDFFDRDEYVVAMDWVDGTDLATLLADRGRPGLAPSSVLAYLAEAADALTHLHNQSPPVIHGDVKPANLILTTGGKVKLVDFGLSSAPNAVGRRTGTPGYRAPELAAGDAPSRASDVYALAATAFALLTGQAPAGVLPRWDGIDPDQARQLEAAIRLGMSTDPARRPKTPGELVERLRAGWQSGLPTGVVTFCFSDIEGSTALWEANPEAMAEALVRHDEIITDAVEARGGSLIDSMGEGDSTVSLFTSAPPAVEAVLAANRALAAEAWPPGIHIKVRWGLHTGETDTRHGDHLGPTVVVAARLRAQAEGGQVFLSSVTSELVAGHLPGDCSLVDLGPHQLKGLTAPEQVFALKGPGAAAPPPVTSCPYRGLLAFEPDDHEYFFGREDVVADLVRRVRPGRLLTVVGASGSGKSSVLRAGLVAEALSGAIPGVGDALVLTPGAEPPLDLPDDPAVLVVVDQFEELFTLGVDADRRDAFIAQLLALRGPVAIGMRADLYGRLGAYPAFARAVTANQVLLGAMSGEELERAVREPAGLAGLKLEPGLVELILRDVADEPGALPLLSHALQATWERRENRTLTVAGYRASGGVASAIGRTADDLVERLPGDQRELVRGVLVRMTELGESSEDSRRRVAVDELVPEGAAPGSVEALLQRLAEARLVTLDEGSAEVAHEALIREWPQLRHWLDEDRAGIRAHQQLGDAARLWDAGGRERTDLYRGTRLAAATELHAELNAVERAFLDASVAEADRERRTERRTNRRLRGLLAGAAVLLVIAVAGGVLALKSRSDAEAQALTADAQRVGALARSAPSLEHSMLYAVAAVEVEDSVETRGDLLAALQRNPAAVRTLHLSKVGIWGVAVSERLLATADTAGLVRFTDLKTWEPDGEPVDLGRATDDQSIAFSPDGGSAAVGTRQNGRSVVHVVDVETRESRRIAAWSGLGESYDVPETNLTYSPDGRRLAVTVTREGPSDPYPVDQWLELLDARTGRRVWRRHYPRIEKQWGAHPLFTSNSRLITSTQQGRTLVWDVVTGRVVRRYRKGIGGSIARSPDGHRLAVALNSPYPGNPSASVGVLDLRTGRVKKLRSFLPDKWIGGLAWTKDGKRIVAAAHESTILFDAASGRILETYGDEQGVPSAGAAITPDGLVVDARNNGSATIWDPQGRERAGVRFKWDDHEPGCFWNPCNLIDPRGDVLAASRGDGRFTLVDLRRKERIADLPARDGPAEGMAFVDGGRRLLTGGVAGTLTLWDVASRTVADVPRPAAGPVRAVAVSARDELLAIQTKADEDASSWVEVRDFRSGITRFRREVSNGYGELAFSPDGTVLVASGQGPDGNVVVAWDARSGDRLWEIAADEQPLSFSIAPDSKAVVVGTVGGLIRLWDLRTGMPRGPATTVAGGGVVQVDVSPDGRLLAVSALDSGAMLWDLKSRTRIGEVFPTVKGIFPQVGFEPSGRLIVGELVSALEWPVDRRSLQDFACRVAGRSMTRAEWRDVLPNQPYRRVC